ncbi:hypothetical protein G6F40_014351 [Rhizopus arrhizus]|nr:hypothetical protein G6F40_014351 [Rhizopus arrhizus]
MAAAADDLAVDLHRHPALQQLLGLKQIVKGRRSGQARRDRNRCNLRHMPRPAQHAGAGPGDNPCGGAASSLHAAQQTPDPLPDGGRDRAGRGSGHGRRIPVYPRGVLRRQPDRRRLLPPAAAARRAAGHRPVHHQPGLGLVAAAGQLLRAQRRSQRQRPER